MAISDAVRQIGATEPTYYHWCKQYGGMNRDQLKRLIELEMENQRLRRAVSDLTLDSKARLAVDLRPRRTILSEAAGEPKDHTAKLLNPLRHRKSIEHVQHDAHS